MNEKWNQPTRYFVIGLLVFLVLLFLFYIRDLLRPLIAAGFVAYLLSPVVAYFSRLTKLSQKASGNIVYFIGLALMVGLISSSIPVLISQANAIAEAFTMVVEQVQPVLMTPLVIGPFKLSLGLIIPAIQNVFTQAATPVLQDAVNFVENITRNAVYMLLIVVVTYYFMVDWADIREWLLRIAPGNSRHDIRHLYWDIRSVWMHYLRGQIVLMLIVGIVFTILYLLIGLPGAIIVGALTGLLTLIPDVGPLIGTIVAVIVALLEGSTYLPISNLLFALLVIAIYGVLIAIKNVWLRPFIMGRSVQMHEGLVFVAILGAVIYEGILGALIVVPVLASIGVIGRYIRSRMLGISPFPEPKEEGQTSDEVFPEVTRRHPKQKTNTPKTGKASK
jgi:predicted PurR-regulated permease PerM